MTGAATHFCPEMDVAREEWSLITSHRTHDWWEGPEHSIKILADMWISPINQAIHQAASEPLEDRFLRIADRWASNTKYTSSVTSMVNDEDYQEIIRLGWDVVPFLLKDLDEKGRFWFPALAAITGIRPFDPIDSSNYQRMKDAWVRWGKRKGLI